MIYIGIDPGLTGAIGVIIRGGHWVFDIPTVTAGKGVVKNEVDPAGLAELLRPYRACSEPATVILERTSAMPGQGVASMFSMGVSRGVILGVLGTLGLPYREVAPATWKRHYVLVGADKDRSRTLAIQRFPTLAPQLCLKKHHNRAEAILLAAYLEQLRLS